MKKYAKRYHRSTRRQHKSAQVMGNMQRLCNESVIEAVDFHFLSGNETFERLSPKTDGFQSHFRSLDGLESPKV